MENFNKHYPGAKIRKFNKNLQRSQIWMQSLDTHAKSWNQAGFKNQ